MTNQNIWILHICHSYYPPFLDCARQYCALFKNTPYQVLTVYLTGEEDPNIAAQTESDEVMFLGYQSKQVKGMKLGAIAKISGIVKQRRYLVCIAHRVKPTYVALLATKLPVISVHHNYHDYRRWSRRILVNYFKNRLLMLGVSNDVRDDLRADLKGWDSQRIQTLYNHIDVKRVQAEMISTVEARTMLGLPDAYVIANVGRLHYDKDQSTLIRAFHQALPQLPKEAILYIAGKGPMEAELKALVDGLGITSKVIFAGHVQAIRQYFKAFDVFALSSDREPFGMVLLEAMAAGLPIICSDCGGAAEVIADTGQYLFPFGNAQALCQCLIAVGDSSVANQDQLFSKLNDCFSDAAVQAQFWQLPFVKALGQ